MNTITLDTLFIMYEYWSHSKTKNINKINLLNKKIPKIALYKNHIEQIEFCIMEGVNEKTAANETELKMVVATKKPKNKRTAKDWQELVTLFVARTNEFLKESVDCKVCPVELDRYNTLVRIMPKDRTIQKNEELGRISKKIYDIDRK